MKRTLMSLFTALAVACGASGANAATFQLVQQIDGVALGTGQVGSVAAWGDTVYVSGLFSDGVITKITDPLGTPVAANQFGASLPGNGRVSLNTDGRTLVAASNNAAIQDTVESYVFGADTLNFSSTASDLGRTRIDGAAVDPNTGNIFVTGFGFGFPLVLDPATGADASDSPTNLFVAGPSTGFRDVDFDNDTGDIYLRAVGGIAGGERTGADDFAKPVNGGAGTDALVTRSDGFNSAINVEFLPASFAGGQELLITNFRNEPDTFEDQVLVYAADAIDTQVAVTFIDQNGSAFGPSAPSGLYDFSFDPVNELLWVADWSNSQVYAFQYIPEPTTALLAALAGVTLAARRR